MKSTTLSALGEAAIAVCFWLLIGLLPVFFLPGLFVPVAGGKQLLLVVLAAAAAIFHLLTSSLHGSITYPRHPASAAVIGLLAVTALSAYFSQAPGIGLRGAGSGEIDTLLIVACLVIVYWLAAVSDWKARPLNAVNPIGLALAAAGPPAALAALQFSGYRPFPWNFAQDPAFTTIGIGAANALAVFLGAALIMILFFLGAGPEAAAGKKRLSSWGRAALTGLALFFFIMLALIRFWVPLLGAALAAAALIGYRLFSRQSVSRPPLALAALIIISLYLTAGNFFPALAGRFLPGFSLPAEVSPSLSATWTIARATLGENVSRLLLGSGPATFPYQYGRYRSPALNASDFWSNRFTQGVDALLTHLVTGGVLGALTWVVFLGLAVAAAARVFKNYSDQPPAKAAAGAGIIYLAAALMVYAQSQSVYFLLFFLTGFVVNDPERRRTVMISGTPRRTAGGAAVVAVLLLTAVIMAVSAIRSAAGSAYFAAAARAAAGGERLELVLSRLRAARAADPRNDLYLTNTSQALLTQLEILGNQPDSPDSQTRFSQTFNQAIEAARRATAVNPLDAQNWLAAGAAYESVIPFVEGSGEFAVASYQKALRREPANPIALTALGRAHLLIGKYWDRQKKADQREKEYGAAHTALAEAIAAKPDYLPARLLLIQLYGDQKKNKEMTAEEETLGRLASADAGVWYQSGLLHYSAGRFTDARRNLERAVEIFPAYSNARYYLGLIYKQQGLREKAIAQFEAVARVSEQNAAQVQKILQELRPPAPPSSKKPR